MSNNGKLYQDSIMTSEVIRDGMSYTFQVKQDAQQKVLKVLKMETS